MDILNLFIAMAALVVAIMVFLCTGGIHDLHHQMEELSFKSDQAAIGARDITVHALESLEHSIQRNQKYSSDNQTTLTSWPLRTESKS